MILSKINRKAKESKNPVINHYNHFNEDKRLLKRSKLPEYLNTMRYIEKYLFEGAKIIEIGAGTGRYSLTLAEMGYDVTAVELVPHNIEIMKKKVKPYHNIKIHEGNACDMSDFANDTFDIVLLLGPMYHLFTDKDKHLAISESIRIAKPGGIIFSSYVNNDTAVYKFFYKRKIMRYMDMGLIGEDFHAATTPNKVFELYRKDEIDNLMRNFNVERLHFVGTDMLSYFNGKGLDRLNDREFAEYMKFLKIICEREDSVGLSIHMLDVFRKL